MKNVLYLKHGKQNKTKYEMFATANDTDSWVIAIDGLMMLTDESAAKELYDSIGPITDSPFFCAQIVAPNSGFENGLGEKYTTFASSCQQADLFGYIEKHGARLNAKFIGQDSLASSTARKTLEDARELAEIFCTKVDLAGISRVR